MYNITVKHKLQMWKQLSGFNSFLSAFGIKYSHIAYFYKRTNIFPIMCSQAIKSLSNITSAIIIFTFNILGRP